MFVKICGITSEEDALLAVALGADALGFMFAPSPRQIAVDRARDIARRLPAEVMTVGVFRDELPDRVVEIVQRAGLRAAQLHGNESAEQTRDVRQRTGIVIKAFPAGHPGLGRIPDYGADIIHIEGDKPGSGELFDWRLAEDAPRAGHRVMLAGGLHPGNVADGIRQVKPWGVDVSSGVEREPGRKDPVKMREFIDNARAAFEEIRPADPADPDDSGLYDWQLDF
ncbi:MAG: N-(5'-phosphoribosyl)anthranilate isomerase [Acidimicrobiales bacterium]|nr:MAG: N-(5'-phosphoribosyl)anthranilate isomerase [Acidimicrobiales bacterium]